MRVLDLTKVIGENAGIMAFGFFDTIHLGHQAVIQRAIDMAKDKGDIASVFLFKNNIFPLLGIDKHPIYTFEERLDFIEALGVDAVFYVDAEPSFLSLTPDAFLAELRTHVTLSGFTCGSDFSFGAKGLGGVPDLINGIGGNYSVLDLLELDGEKISSERIKAALSRGDLLEVKDCLGRDFSIKRQIVRGRNDGAKIGFPTMNTDLYSLPLRAGVYFTKVTVEGVSYRAVTNVGAHPTFSDMKMNIESFLLSFDGDLYGREILISFLKYHRAIEKYDSPELLAERIAKDVSERRKYD